MSGRGRTRHGTSRRPKKIVNSLSTKKQTGLRILLRQTSSPALCTGKLIPRAFTRYIWLPIALSRGRLFKELKNVASHRQRKAVREVRCCRTAGWRDALGRGGYAPIGSPLRGHINTSLLHFASSSTLFRKGWDTAREGSQVAHSRWRELYLYQLNCG